MTYRVGDKINPEEPPIGARLRSKGADGTFTIERDRKGWHIVGTHTRISWRAVLSAWGPGAGQALEVTKLP